MIDTENVAADASEESIHSSWHFLGHDIPRSEITFFSQVIVVYIVIITCIVNLSLNNGDSNLWTALLSSCLGYLLSSPTIRSHKTGRIRIPSTVTTQP